MKWTNPGHEFDEVAKAIHQPDNIYYLWGAGVFGKSTYEQMKDEITIAGFIDSNPEKQSREYCGQPVFAPSILHNKKPNIKIIVTTGWTTQVFNELDKLGYQLNVDYFSNEIFTSVFFMYRDNFLYLPRLDFMITTKCVLKCKHCGMHIPYYPEHGHMPMDKIKEQLSIFFNYVDSLGVLGISGGDAFLHPELEQIVEYIGETYYGTKLSSIEVYTNAIIMPSESLLKVFQKYGVILRFTDYSKALPGRQKIEEFLHLCAAYGIEVEHVKLQAWYDYGLLSPTCHSMNENQLISHFGQCASQCRGLHESRLYFCYVGCSAMRAGLIDDDPNDYFELTPFSQEKKRVLMEFNIGFNNLGYLAACQYCRGNQNVNHCYIEVGEQLNEGEQR